MKIDIEQNSAYEETAVTIRCAGLSREVMELLALLRVYDAKQMCIRDSRWSRNTALPISSTRTASCISGCRNLLWGSR